MSQSNQSLIATGLAVGLDQLTNLKFDINSPWTCCRVCGAVYQSGYDRTEGDLTHNAMAMELRRDWSVYHARTHSEKEHISLALSGAWCTPDAAKRLAAFGIIPVSDMILNEEVKQALIESSAIPINDAEGSDFKHG